MNKIRNFFSQELTLDENSWNYRFLYLWWLRYLNSRASWFGDELLEDYQENLCHYMRVILFYVPTFWSFRTHLYGWVTPAWAFFMLGTTAYVGVSFLSWPPEYIILALVQGTIATSIGALVTSWYWLAPDIVKKTFVFLSAPIWYPAKLLGRLFVRLWEIGLDEATEWFFLHRLASSWARPWMVAAEALLALSPLVFGLETMAAIIVQAMIAMLILVVIVAISVTIAAIARGGKYLIDHWLRGRSVDIKPKGASTLQLAGQYILARKRKICPLINLPENRLSIINE